MSKLSKVGGLIVLSSFALAISLTAVADQGAGATAGKTVAPVTPGFKPAPQGARVFFANLKNGQKIPTKFLVKFGLEGMTVKPAGELVAGTGHHHLIIDGSAVPPGQVIPMDDTHKHFGKGQTETEITLAPGKHKLTLQFADGAHLSYGPMVSDTIDVVVTGQ